MGYWEKLEAEQAEAEADDIGRGGNALGYLLPLVALFYGGIVYSVIRWLWG